MSVRRLLGTSLGMAVTAVLLGLSTPAVPTSLSALGAAQRTADTAGADVLVLHLVGVLTWAVWGWGALGLALTACSVMPGTAGALADGALRGLLPRSARRAASLALGVGLGIAPPLLAAAAPGLPAAAAEEFPARPGPGAGTAVPDWPAPAPPAAPTPHDAARADALPDWPPARSLDEHVVVRGDCLWRIAEDHLARTSGRTPATAEVATAVAAWWRTNAEVIGPDPDLLLPGQVLRPPALP